MTKQQQQQQQQQQYYEDDHTIESVATTDVEDLLFVRSVFVKINNNNNNSKSTNKNNKNDGFDTLLSEQ